jgi:carboxyl-terminal processing protease
MMMKKIVDKRTLFLAVMILTVVTTGVFITILINTLEAEADAYKELEVFKEALTIVRKNYVEDIQSKDLINGAIKGMVESLDTHPDFIQSEQYKRMKLDTKSYFMSKLIGTEEPEVDRNDEMKLFKDTMAIVRRNHEEDIQQKDLIYGAIKGMVGSLDAHSDFMTPEQYSEMEVDAKGEFGGIGIKLDFKEGVLTVIDLLDDTPAFKSGIKEGDKIIRINNELTKEMSLQNAVSKMRGTPSTTVKISVLREGWKETKDFTITRKIIKIQSVKSKMLKDGIGYIKIYQFQKQTAPDLSAALSRLTQDNMKSLILDLRDNPGGLLYSAVDIAGHFIPSGKLVVYTKDRKGIKKEYLSRKNNSYSTLPVVVIVNEGSASASEILAGALKDWHRATIIGTTTYGKGSVQTVVPLKDGSALKLTTSKYYTPKGISIQTTGISPDILVKPKMEKAQHVQHVHPVIGEKEHKVHLNTGNTEQIHINKEIVSMISYEREDIQLQSAIDFLKTKTFRISTPTAIKNVWGEPSVSNM